MTDPADASESGELTDDQMDAVSGGASAAQYGLLSNVINMQMLQMLQDMQQHKQPAASRPFGNLSK